MTVSVNGVVFDLGGVLTSAPFAGVAGYERECRLPAGSIVRYFRHDAVYHQLERGEITAREFWKSVGVRVEEEHGVRIDLAALASATEASSSVNRDAVALLRELRGLVRLALLTNNVTEASRWRHELPLELFDAVVDSSAVGVRKPDPRIYQIILEQLGLPAHEVVFIDDFEENLPPAAALGMRTHLFTSLPQCRSELVRLGVLDAAGRERA
jgi:epoxide hydrolase-like predicted phosphatase